MGPDREWVDFSSREHLREWLTVHHQDPVGVWAVYARPSLGVSDMSWEVLVEECLCFGWIDSLPGKVDEHRTRTYISPRKPRSGWSRRNQVLVEELQRSGRMHASGAAVVDAARADGSWYLFDLAEDLVLPSEMEAVFARNPKARSGFEAYPERTRKALLQWYYSARTETTRRRRCGDIADAAARGVKPKGF